MRIDFCAAIFQEGTDVSKMRLSCSGVACKGGMSGPTETLADAGSILVQDENGEDVAEDHANNNEADAAEKKKAARAEPRKRLP